MAFNIGNLSFQGDILSSGRTYKWNYSTSDSKMDVQQSNYFPKGHIRTGDVLVVAANDGDIVLLAREFSDQVSVFIVFEG